MKRFKILNKFGAKRQFLLVLICFTLLTVTYNALKNVTEMRILFNINESNINKFVDQKGNKKYIIPKFRWCPMRKHSNLNIDCTSLIGGDKSAINSSKRWKSPCPFSDAYLAQLTKNCTNLEKLFPHWSDIRERFLKINKTQENYQLAFVIVGAKNAEQMIRLFQSVYTSDNLYCLAYDNKTKNEFKTVLHNLNKCYSNVLMPNEFVDIYWAGFSILHTVMNCLKALYNEKSHKWKYVQILSWNDYPLRTNEEMIKIMQIFNGSQDSLLHKAHVFRSRFYFNVKKTSMNMEGHLAHGKEDDVKPIPPGNLTEYKGSLATTMSRKFIQFIFENSVARQLYAWSNTSYMAEEMYFSTLIHNLHINPPGGFPGTCQQFYEKVEGGLKPYVSRYQIWQNANEEECAGKYTFHSCVYGVGDLRNLSARPELIAHKIYLNYQPALYYCLSLAHYNRTMFPHKYANFDLNFYKNLPSVRYQNMPDKTQFTCL